MHNNFDDVGLFHDKFELDNVTIKGAGPRETPRELIEFRLKFLLEELKEFAEACGYTLAFGGEVGKKQDAFFYREENAPPLDVDHAKAFDSLLDLAYVVFGTAHVMGYPWHHGWEEVQRANMTKERCLRAEDSTRGSTFDVIKPPGWTPPDITTLLASFGWRVKTLPLKEGMTDGPKHPEYLCEWEQDPPCVASKKDGSSYCAAHSAAARQ